MCRFACARMRKGAQGCARLRKSVDRSFQGHLWHLAVMMTVGGSEQEWHVTAVRDRAMVYMPAKARPRAHTVELERSETNPGPGK